MWIDYHGGRALGDQIKVIVFKHKFSILNFRFVSAGSAMNAAVVPGTADRFKFDYEYNITHDLVRKLENPFDF